MIRSYACATTALAVGVVWTCQSVITPGDSAFASGVGARQHIPAPALGAPASNAAGARTAALAGEVFGTRGLLGFGACFGLLAAVVRAAGSRTAMKAGEIKVAEKKGGALAEPEYLKLPRSIIEKSTLDRLLASVPREEWDNPPEDSHLWSLKMYAETYGENKARKMSWWDYWYMKQDSPDDDDLGDPELWAREKAALDLIWEGKCAIELPLPGATIKNGAVIKFRGPEPFAGDQIQSPIKDSGFAKQFIGNMAWYREGLKPWQRGLEIGMAHGYFIIGPFVALGPLRNTPEAATVGLLCGCAVIGLASVGGLLFGSTIRPTFHDEPSKPRASGFIELINWHALGGIGGAGFAHMLITVFGS